MDASPTTPETTPTGLDARSRELRRTIVRMIDAGGRGHVGAAFSIVEIVRVLYDHVLRVDPASPRDPGRDRFILSKGHGCLALFAVLEEKGFFPEEELWRFCKRGGILAGHPEIRVPGVEASTGSLGHGLSIGIGMALHARIAKAPYRVFVLVGDGESNEGSIWEGAMSAAKHGLDSLTLLVDYNQQQSYGSTHEVLELEPFAAKWEAFGFAVTEVDGHDVDALRGVLETVPVTPGKPSAIICHTVKGKGAALTERNLSWHHKSKISPEELVDLMTAFAEV